MRTDTEKKETQKRVYTSAQEFIKEMNEKQKKKEQEIKNEVLIHLGLIDQEKSHREYFPYWVNDKCKWDEEVGKYYIGKNVPLDVSDEEYEEILKYAEFDFEVEEIEKKRKKSTNWGKYIEFIAWIVLMLTIIPSIFIFIVGFQWDVFLLVIGAIPSFCILMGFAELVSAAEKYLRK